MRILLCLLLSGCVCDLERTRLNHPLMSFESRLLKPSPQLTNLGSIEASTAGGKCETCAH
jgi:hypothetical protein